MCYALFELLSRLCRLCFGFGFCTGTREEDAEVSTVDIGVFAGVFASFGDGHLGEVYGRNREASTVGLRATKISDAIHAFVESFILDAVFCDVVVWMRVVIRCGLGFGGGALRQAWH